MKCALCHRDEPLQNSHIIPEFLYRSLYDSKHRFHQISLEQEKPVKYFQKGLREPLLCLDCERKLSVWERYASLFLNGGIEVAVRREGTRLYLSDLDYSKFKLFQLSILWRSSVSMLPEFSQVVLGPHEERLRQQLLSEDPGLADSYGCLMCALMQEQEILKDLIVPPTWARLGNQKAYRFVFGGLVFIYVVSSLPSPGFIAEHFLQRDGKATLKLQQINEMNFLTNTFGKLHRMGKFDI